jgi:hypothetical protein
LGLLNTQSLLRPFLTAGSCFSVDFAEKIARISNWHKTTDGKFIRNAFLIKVFLDSPPEESTQGHFSLNKSAENVIITSEIRLTRRNLA